MSPFLQSEWIDYEVGDLAIPSRGVHFWEMRPSNVFVRYLSAAESLRYEGIANGEVKSSYGTAQGGLRRVISFYMGCLPGEVNMRRERRGKPYVPGAPDFNLSHTAGRTFAAFSSRPVGLDVESAHRRVRAEAVARKFFSREETERLTRVEASIKALTFLRYWVCKEAITKLSGDGIYYGLRYARVDLASDGRSRGEYKGQEVWLREFRPANDLVAALASWEPLEAKGFFRI
ncbi:MAG: 4'-phosphopantetheinyl transferase superfamily protein [Terrimicrobiaceae bacterium]